MNSLKKINILLLTIIFTVGFIAPAYSNGYYYNQINQHKNKLQNTKSKLQYKKELVKTLEKRESDATINLTVIQKRLENTQVRLADTQYRYEQAQRQIQATQTKLNETEKDLSKQMSLTKKTLKRMYKHKYSDYFMFIFKSDDLSSFIRRSTYFNYLVEQDNEHINKIKNKKKEIKEIKEDYTKKKIQIASIAKKMAVQKSIYEDRSEKLEQYKERVQSEKAIYEREAIALERDSDRIASMLKSLKNQMASQPKGGRRTNTYYAPTYTGGRMGWPCAVTSITSYYGYRIHPIFGTRRLHTGMDVGADQGTQIYAAANGTVVEAGWAGGYGKAIIINHGGSIATLYGHTSVLYVYPGQRVKRGQLIAGVGSTGNSTGPHLHFEVRVNGNPVDPLPYFR